MKMKPMKTKTEPKHYNNALFKLYFDFFLLMGTFVADLEMIVLNY